MKRQRGFATIAVVVVAAIAVVGVGYLLLSRTGKVPAVPGLAAVTLNDKCEYNDKDLCKFLNNTTAFDNFTVTGTSTGAGSNSAYTFKSSGEDKFQNIMSTDGKEVYNMIVIGDTTYTKDYADNKWFKSTTTKDDKEIKDDITFSDDVEGSTAVQQKPTYTRVGTEACGKRTCFKYQVATPGSDGTELIWFDNKEYRLRKTESRGTDNSVSVSEYSYDKVKISAPSPVKEGQPTYSVPEAALPSVDAGAGAEADTSAEVGADYIEE